MPVNRKRGFTLLEMVVATLIMGIAVVGLLSGISGATRNAARLRDYDRVVQMARWRMNELLLDQRLPRNATVDGSFDPAMAGGLDAGWRAQLTMFEMPPVPAPGQLALEQIRLEVWWMAGGQRRTLALESLRRKTLRPEDMPAAVAP
jgi:general secretion pathway protein I